MIVKYHKRHGKVSLKRLELGVRMLPGLPNAVSQWWTEHMFADASSIAQNISNDLLLHTIELARNALEYSDKVLIIAQIQKRKWTILVSDEGPGMDPQSALKNSLNGGFGFRNAVLFADTFIVETFGRRYEKRRNALLYIGDGTIFQGVTIALGKMLSET